MEYGNVSIGANPSTTSERSTQLITQYGGVSATSTTITQGKAQAVTQYGSMSKLQ